MKLIHILCSINVSPSGDKDRSLAPLRTILEHLIRNDMVLGKTTFVSGCEPNDAEFLMAAKNVIGRERLADLIACNDREPETFANAVSKAASDAAASGATLWVDITPGPKSRAAVLYSAACVLPGVKVVYSESVGGQYEVRDVVPLKNLNSWLGRHGAQLRNYREELESPLAALAAARKLKDIQPINLAAVTTSIDDLLTSADAHDHVPVGPRSVLLQMAELLSELEIPSHDNSSMKSVREFDRQDINAHSLDGARHGCQWCKSMIWSTIALYQLRCLFSHPPRSSVHAGLRRHDVLMLLDTMAFVSARMQDCIAPLAKSAPQEPPPPSIYIALDGDDVGRRFEERLARCSSSADAGELSRWSHATQRALSECFVELAERWQASSVARTGDGFLAAAPEVHLESICRFFRPRLGDATVTVGLGPTVKEAYLALKLGKAANRGGGYFFRIEPHEEKALWNADGRLAGPASI
jgi:hypothetical protein